MFATLDGLRAQLQVSETRIKSLTQMIHDTKNYDKSHVRIEFRTSTRRDRAGREIKTLEGDALRDYLSRERSAEMQNSERLEQLVAKEVARIGLEQAKKELS